MRDKLKIDPYRSFLYYSFAILSDCSLYLLFFYYLLLKDVNHIYKPQLSFLWVYGFTIEKGEFISFSLQIVYFQ